MGPAGSVLVFHHGLWHSGRGNVSGPDRLMYKLRLNPSVSQVRLWDAGDLDERQNGPDDHIFARFDRSSVAAILRRPELWWEQASGAARPAAAGPAVAPRQRRQQLRRRLLPDPDRAAAAAGGQVTDPFCASR